MKKAEYDDLLESVKSLSESNDDFAEDIKYLREDLGQANRLNKILINTLDLITTHRSKKP